MRNMIVVTPGFCKAELLDLSLQQYYEYQKGNYEHWILLNHYPVHKAENDIKTIEIAKKYNCKTLDCAADISLHGSTNLLLKHLGWPDNTLLLSFDADSGIEQMSHGFDVVMSETMDEGIQTHNIGILALWGIGIDLKYRKNKQEFKKVFIKNNAVLIHPSVEMWSVSMFDLDFIKAIGGLSQTNKYYGGIEVAMIRGFKQYNKCLAYLTEYKEKYFMYPAETSDPEYAQYKYEHLHGFTESFEEWLKIHKPELI
jgi:hypothetical protein